MRKIEFLEDFIVNGKYTIAKKGDVFEAYDNTIIINHNNSVLSGRSLLNVDSLIKSGCVVEINNQLDISRSPLREICYDPEYYYGFSDITDRY